MRVCVHRGECMRVYMSACVCTVFKKKYARRSEEEGGRKGRELGDEQLDGRREWGIFLE